MRIFLVCCLTSCGFLPSLFPDECLRDFDCKTNEFCQQETKQCVPREICDNGIDEDLDGLTDCKDLLDCFATAGCATAGQVTTLSLGEVLPNEEVTFPIPEGTEGFTLVVKGGEENVIGIQRLVAPDGEVRVNGFGDEELRQFNSQEAIGFILPQGDNDQNVVTPGLWRLTLGSSIVEALQVDLMVRLGPLSGGAFALNLYLPRGLRMCRAASCEGGAGASIEAVSAATFSEVSGLLHTLSEGFLSQLGIDIEGVNFYEVDEEFLFISSLEELQSMFQRSTPGGLNVFLVQEFSPSIFSATLAGISSGIPGAVGTFGTKNSGVAIKVALDPEFSDNINGRVTAHELGHFLGLWHTTEFNGGSDLLLDTPACLPEVISSNVSLCPDFHYIMFPSLSGDMGIFSETQQRVLRAGVGYQ
jgi:hypothetical protein